MRTIKFRGKKVTNGVWAYGSLVYLDENGAAIYVQTDNGSAKVMDLVYVDPDLRYILTGEGFKDNELRPYTHILFRYGYTRRTMLREIESITIGRGNPKWCAPTDKDVFIIKFS